MRTTMKDIAKATGSSIATVSLVLNDKEHKIAESTKKLIKETAIKMHYVPNQMARGLVGNKSKIIAVIVPDITNMHFARMAKYIQEEAVVLGYHTGICISTIQCNQEEWIKVAYQNGVAGIIMIVEDDAIIDQTIEMAKQLEINLMVVGSTCADLEADGIIINHQYGTYLATSYLIQNGHKKIGYITESGQSKIDIERLKGYKKALEEYEVTFNEAYVYQGSTEFSTGECGAKKLISKGVTGICVFDKLLVYGIYQEATKMNVSIPEQLSLIGIEDIFLEDRLPISLTTVEQPVKKMMEHAMKRLVERIETKRAIYPRNYVFNPELKIRGSVGKI